MNARERFATDSTPALSAITPQLEALTERLGVKSVLVMRSEPDAMVVAATAGEATQQTLTAGDTLRHLPSAILSTARLCY